MVIESAEEFSKFFELYKDNDVIIIPVLCDAKRHVAANELSFLFIKILNINQYFILSFNHNECVSLPRLYFDELASCNNKKYIFDKKNAMYILPFPNLIDINILYYLKSNTSYDFESISSPLKSHAMIQRVFDEVKNVNRALPILKYYEKLVDVSNKLEQIIADTKDLQNESSFPFLNNDTLECLQKIESGGLFVDNTAAVGYFPQIKRHITEKHLVFTEYNIYTATGRPANRFGNVNFAALNKDNRERSCFKSRFGATGQLVMFDYDAYHLRLIADMVGYEFPQGVNIHEYLGKIYSGKEELTQEEYEKSKQLDFELVYGGIDKSVAEAIPFFGKVKAFTDTMWQAAQILGYTETLVSKKKIWLSNFNSLNKTKLFNYILQNYETEQNILTIKQIQNTISNTQIKLILYLYDGFLFDIDAVDMAMLPSLRTIIQREGKFLTKLYIGDDFQNLIKIQ